MAKSQRTTSGRTSRANHSPRSAVKKSAGRKPAAKQPAARNSSTRRGTSQQSKPEHTQSGLGSISAERKMDVAGIILAVIGLLTFLSLLSGTRGIITGAWVSVLRQIAGWGVFVLPLALISVGAWLLLRHAEKIPLPSLERLVGILLLFVNLMVWLHLIPGGGWDLAKDGRGGGYVGALFERGLVTSIGSLGAAITLVAWFLIGVVFTFDLSIADLATLFSRKTREVVNARKEEAAVAHARPVKPNLVEGSTESIGMEEAPANFQPIGGVRSRPVKITASSTATPAHGEAPAQHGSAMAKQSEMTPASTQPSSWQMPSLEAILDPATPVAIQANVETERARKIEETLASFGAPVHVVEIQRGPTVTLFGVEPDFIESRSGRTRVRVAKIVALIDDLSLVLAANVRIQAPVPGRSYVGIEVPNAEVSRVSLREVMESDSFTKKRSPLRFALGKDVSGSPVSADLTTMPHLLIAGTTGSGKSVCVNSLLCCFLLNNSPEDLRLVLVDPKRVELTGYNGIPHLLAPVVVEPGRVVKAMEWILREMDSRYHKFLNNGVRNIGEYNHRFPNERLPFLLVVIDELADLMMMAPDETERAITRLAQLARATGIHLIIATQRPSVDVVTGLIKANFPARIAFAVAAGVDSRVILDQPGAERLLGRGDMLFQAPDAPAPVRLQGCYVSDPEIQRLVDTWRVASTSQPTVATMPTEAGDTSLPHGVPLEQRLLWDEEPEKYNNQDPYLEKAIAIVREEGKASITMLQRKMRIGYTRAARMIDAMEDMGVISETQPNSQVRDVLDYGEEQPDRDQD